MTKRALTAERLRELLDYDPTTGIFINRGWRGGKTHASGIAGSIHRRWGYVLIDLDGSKYRAHRLAWLYIHGEFPCTNIDHKDGVRTNNRIANLREANQMQNQQNRRCASRNSKSGILGVSQHSQTKRWVARIGIDGIYRHLGCYGTAEEASAAYMAAKVRHHPFQMLVAL